MALDVAELTTDDEWDEAVPLLCQLWTDADPASVRSWRDEEGYHLFGGYDDGELVGVVGASVQRVLHHVRHAWVHDLVVDEPRRGEGHGAELLAHVESWARERDCEAVALANVLDNERALSFYEECGMDRFGYVLERGL